MPARQRGFRVLQTIVVLLAVSMAVLPLPRSVIERYYSDWWYPHLQARLTAWSNESTVSLFDVLLLFVAAGLIVAWLGWLRQALGRRSVRPLVGGLAISATVAALIYLWFQLAWGLNYARAPLESVVDYDARRVTPERLRGLADRATNEVNALYDAAHAAGFPADREPSPALVRAVHEVERELGRPAGTVPSRPKRTLLGAFFRWAGVDGMHAPFLLETLLNPDLTPVERPAVLAHEWAHLSGYAPEDDASFVGLLAALRADPGSRYSAWLAIFHETVVQLPRAEQRQLLSRLATGPQQDRQAIAARQRTRIEAVSTVSWQAYDRYLKAQGVEEGVQNYGRVVRLLLGTDADLRPRLSPPAPPAGQ